MLKHHRFVALTISCLLLIFQASETSFVNRAVGATGRATTAPPQVADVVTACASKADYRFKDTLNTSVGAAPALGNLGSGNTYITANVDGSNRTVLRFPTNDGLVLDPIANVISAQVYTIVLLFSFDEVTGYRRILDFKHGSDDSGLYFLNGRLAFYPSAEAIAGAIAANTFNQVVLTRDASKNVIGYVNGVQQFSFVDTDDLAVIDSSNLLRFFRDNDSGGPSDESSAGTLARIRLYDCVFSAAEVSALDRLAPAPAAGCPIVDSFNPTLAAVGGSVAINGSGLTGVSAVRFSPSVNSTFGINNDGLITVVVPTGAVNGPMTLVKSGCSDTVTAHLTVVRPVVCVSAASFQGAGVATQSVVACFGNGLATSLGRAGTVPLPTTLAGTTVKVRDSTSTERAGPLFFVSAGQLNMQIPPGTALGLATVTVTAGDGVVSRGQVMITEVSPGIFTANASGQGVPAAFLIRVKPGNVQSQEDLLMFDFGLSRFVPKPIDLGPENEQVFLVLFGTGWRFRSALSGVSLGIGGVSAPVAFAGNQGFLIGLDQLNALIPRTLIGRGEVNVNLVVDTLPANTVVINVK